jgi:hypothetical protein
MRFKPTGNAQRQKNYRASYREGWLSAKYLHHYSVIAATWPEWSIPGHAQGYEDGWRGFRAGQRLPEGEGK